MSASIFGAPTGASAQTGVDDDRVSLPEGPGSLEGVGENVEIDPNMGSMRYNVPLVIPQGLNGLTPAVGLNYSSSAGSSVVGVGWSMTTSSIERMTMRGTPLYGTDDYFAVDGGDELVQVSESGDERVFRARFEGGFVRYTWRDVGDGAGGYWTAEFPDGSISYYGAGADEQLVASARSTNGEGGVYKYHLVERQDVYGNRIRYSYDSRGGNWPLVSEIGYVYSGDTALYKIVFEYEDRPDALSDAGAGYEELLRHRLSGIQVQVDGQVVNEWALTYEDMESAGGFSRLQNVQRYGLGGKDAGFAYPIAFTFGYSRALGVGCEGDACDSPYLVNMGQASQASGLATGAATLVDINADGLPDVVDSTDPGAHRILINRLTSTSDGFDHTFEAAIESTTGTGTSFGLSSDIVQTADVNGDGLSDVFNARSGATLLSGYGLEDWRETGAPLTVDALIAVDLSTARFIDYNNDKRVDIITSTSTTTVVYENQGSSFVTKTIDPIGVEIGDNEFVQFADMNGDGYNDVVELQGTGSLRYRLNYGWGTWSQWRSVTNLSFTTSERELVDLEDLNGDGISDVVIVTPSQVKYAINRNGDRFDDFETITSDDISGTLPERQTGDIVLYADMNANGSEDVVWFDMAGQVQYLELFPVRPNLLSRIENGIGFVTNVTYTTSAEEEARARAAGDEWDKKLSIPMNIVSKTDTFVTLTGGEDGSGLHDIDTYVYRDGFYDGVEKQFRGFETVEVTQMANMAQEGGLKTLVYHLGEDKPHFNGLLRFSVTRSGDRVIDEVTNTYEECDLAGIPSPSALEEQGRFGVYFPCLTSAEFLIKEGASEAQWVTIRGESEFDGYGNVTLASNRGDVAVTGDEAFTETEYYYPGDGDRWFVGLPLQVQTWADASGAVKTQTQYYYDGEDFVGTQTGLTHGFLSRSTTRVDANSVLESVRNRRDDRGNIIEVIDANGSIEDPERHRRTYTYDERGLFVTFVDVKVEPGFVLRRGSEHDIKYQKPTSLTDWILVQDGQEISSRNAARVEYDEFGRQVRNFDPGAPDDKPTQEFIYDLGDPFSRITTRVRTERDGDAFEETVACRDGRGREYQTRVQTGPSEWLVSGFTVYNDRGAEVEVFDAYASDSGDCASEPPMGVLSRTFEYDATFRVLTASEPGEDVYGERLISTSTYEPLRMINSDAEDRDPSGVHANTPTIKIKDGQGRLKEIQRVLRAGEAPAVYTLFYDETGSFSGYTDPEGNRHELVVDLAGRIEAVRNPTTGEVSFVRDALGNVLERTDARGTTTVFVYDGANRLIEVYDKADREGTAVKYHYDTVPEGCPVTDCTNLANRLAEITYPTPFGVGRDRMGYDSRLRVAYQGRVFGDAVTLDSRNTYSNVGRIDEVTHSDGTTLAWEYDLAGRPSRIAGFIDSMQYDDRGDLSKITYANLAATELFYDGLNRLESRINKDGAGKVIEGIVMDRDRAGNILTIEDMGELMGITHDASYVYDAWYRVVEASQKTSGQDDVMSYAFDALDRITSVTSSLGMASAANVGALEYDPSRPLALASAGGVDIGFDAAGHMNKRGEMTFEWDHLRRMVSATRGARTETHVYGAEKERVAVLGEDSLVLYGFASSEVRDGVSYVYVRPHGDRLAKSISTALMTEIYEDVDGDGSITAHDAYAGNSDNGALGRAHALGAAAARVLAEQGDAKVFFHHDMQNSVVSATDEGGAVIGRRAYSPTGVLREEDGYVDVYGFTGQEYNPFTELIQFAMRDLDPKLGRWTSFDPAFVELTETAMEQLGEATTGYAYVANNFMNVIDPNGLDGENNKKGNVKKTDVTNPSKEQDFNQAAGAAFVQEADAAGNNFKFDSDKKKDAAAEAQTNTGVEGESGADPAAAAPAAAAQPQGEADVAFVDGEGGLQPIQAGPPAQPNGAAAVANAGGPNDNAAPLAQQVGGNLPSRGGVTPDAAPADPAQNNRNSVIAGASDNVAAAAGGDGGAQQVQNNANQGKRNAMKAWGIGGMITLVVILIVSISVSAAT
ncbi:MAG: toxin TcdB middle/N-terminal domain-containing protein [Myxococcota bacterium]